MNGLWSRLDAIIADHHGHVDKHMGDSVMAVWGIDGTDELDADRAVRAGLALQSAVLDRGRRGGRPGDARRNQHRTGADRCGRIGWRADGDGRHRQRGQPTRTGSTDRRCADRPRHLPPHPRRVRGVDAGARRGPRQERADADLHRAERANRGPSASAPAASKVSRPEPWAATASWPACRACTNTSPTGTGRALVVIGEAGIGKSRLLYDLRVWLELRSEKIRLVEGRARCRAAGNHARAHPRHVGPALRDPRQRLGRGGRPQVARRVRRGAHTGRRRHGRRLARARHHRAAGPPAANTSPRSDRPHWSRGCGASRTTCPP